MPLNHSVELQAPYSKADQLLYATHQPGWLSGIKGEERPTTPGADTGVLALIVMLLILIGLNMRHVRHLFQTITQSLWSVRRRANAFDDHTAKETRTIIILLLQLCVFQGILLYLWLGSAAPTAHSVFLPVLQLTGLAIGFYLFQLIACTVVGYVFTDKVGAAQWRSGLNSSSVLLGICLTVPTLVSLFYPALTTTMLWLSAGLYVLFRIIYIGKGFRIFYYNFPSLLYFILYLCTLEIIPLIGVYLTAMEICK
jgi:hypothetical protein